MPEIRTFIVTQTREVKVTANSAADAMLLAEAAFVHGQNSANGIAIGKGPEGIWGNTDSRIREVGLAVEERR